MIMSSHLYRVRSFLAMAFCMLLVVALRHAQLASGETEGWGDWSYAPWQALGQLPSSSVITRWPWHQESSLTGSTRQFHGKYASHRSTMDYSYHSNYSKSRKALQDQIIDTILNSSRVMDDKGRVCETPAQPWIVFTAGAMGAGKSWTIRHLAERGRLPLQSFVTVDPDDIRRHLPEFQYLIENHPEDAGEHTRKEAGFIAELLTHVALEQGKNVLVDGSLRDATWYRIHFAKLRRQYAKVQIAILHITAPRSLVFARAHSRSKTTGRVVPHSVLEQTLEQVPKSVDILKSSVDFFAEVHNAQEIELVAGGTWDSFQQVWSQNCRL